jgi:phage-related minor tail protein
VELILREKQDLISENRELNKQLSEAEDEIALLKQQIEEMRCTAARKESELEVEQRRSMGLQNIKEQNIMLQLELREYRQERERLH